MFCSYLPHYNASLFCRVSQPFSGRRIPTLIIKVNGILQDTLRVGLGGGGGGGNLFSLKHFIALTLK